MEKEFIANKIKQTEVSIQNNTAIMGFYQWLADREESKQKKAEHLIKVDQVKATKEFDEQFLEYLKTL